MDERHDGGSQADEPLEIEFVDVEDGVAERDDRGLEPVEAREETAGAPGEAGTAPAPAEGGEGGGGSGAEVEELRSELARLRELYLRKLAEFDNFRKRVEREREDVRINAAADVIRELVPVMDNFDRALAHADADPGALRQGVEMIARQLWDALTRQGLEVIDPTGAVFDPEVHEAVQRVEDSEHEPGTVVHVLGKGYVFRGRLVRPAMVAVAVEPAERTPDEGEKGGNGS